MSIKSQKSLNEECSEIFEKSYSVRSVFEDSLSGDDEEESLSRELLKKLTPAVLSKLRRSFKKAKDRNAARDIDRRVEEVMRAAAAEEGIEFAESAPATPSTPSTPSTLYLNEHAFVDAFHNIFGNSKYTTHARQLFQTLDTFRSGRVWWEQVVARLAAAGARDTISRSEKWKPVTVTRMLQLQHCKRETIIKLVSIERADSFCYVAVSRGGRVGVYSGDLHLLHTYEVFYHRTGVHRRVKNCWITDAVHMSDVQCLLLSASDRSLTVYDVTTLTHSPLYCVTGLPNIPTCLAYSPFVNSTESLLLVGSERGEVVRVRFLQPRVSLFYVNTPDDITYCYWMELFSPPHSHYCHISTSKRVHSRSVRRLSVSNMILSCAQEANVSLRAKHASGMLADYIFTVQRGVTSFHSVPSLRLVVTGSADGVRLWETPHGALAAHLSSGPAPVLDVGVVVTMEIVVAYCSNCFLYIWDLYEECLLQTVKIKFPFLGVLGKKVEFGTYCLHPGPPRQKVYKHDTEVMSRRCSSVYQSTSGGLQLNTSVRYSLREMEVDLENKKFDRPEILLTCCDFVCVVSIRDEEGSLLPPPRNTLRARRPSFWELPADLMHPSTPSSQSPRSSKHVLIEAEGSAQHVDMLLEQAGLQGILEKDFVLMQGLKHDLNQKLHQLENDKEATRWALNAGAPSLALRSAAPEPLPDLDQLAEQYTRIMRLFPVPSTAVTPSGSEHSSPHVTKFLNNFQPLFKS